ncbi:MAG: LamG-like jellyroll fold domain-containing protein, partial [Planctomycetota bacterium]
DGQISDIAIYDSVLSPEQVTAIANGEPATPVDDISLTSSSSAVEPAILEALFALDAPSAEPIAADAAYGLTEATISFGFNADEVDGQQFLFSRGNYLVGERLGLYIEDGKLYALVTEDIANGASNDMEIIGGAEVSADTDHTVALSFNGTELKLYLDGAEIAAIDSEVDWVSEYQDRPADPIHFGGNGLDTMPGSSDVAARSLFDGQISDIAIYDSVLSPEQVTAIANG